MIDFEEFWESYGELASATSNGDIKTFAREIWTNFVSELEPKFSAHKKDKECPKCHRKFLHLEKPENDGLLHGTVHVEGPTKRASKDKFRKARK